MTDYYKFLQVASTASADEIEEAIEDKFNKWRRLVTHHDHNVADEANRALRTLEEARSMLLDPAKRRAYDQTRNAGGLADPEAAPPVKKSPPPPSSLSSIASSESIHRQSQPEPRIDAWVCAECGTANKTGMLYCKQCGNQIGRECPNCSSLVEASAPFCSGCGVKFEDALRAVKEDYIRQLQHEIQTHLTAINKIEQRRGIMGNLLSSFEGTLQEYWAYLLGGYAILFLLSLLVEDGACLAPLLCLTFLAIPLWFAGHQQLSQSIREINVHRKEIDELEAHIRTIQAKEIDQT